MEGGGVNVSILGGPKRAAVGFKGLYTVYTHGYNFI